jgi:4,5-DOPA dioxygenase extradiol
MNLFRNFSSKLNGTDGLMPALFIGHGSPMNGVEDNEFSRRWADLAKEIPVPRAVLVVSAHWQTRGVRITAMDFPQTIHDFSGFPQTLYDVQYPAPGNPDLAKEAQSMITSTKLELDHDWGLDHGTWTVVRHMFPQADVPVLQLSLDYKKDAEYHYNLGRELYDLRKKGVLIIGSGNIVHNLRMLAWDRLNETNYGFDWALQINERIKSFIKEGNHQPLINYTSLGRDAMMAIPTPEHYLPLLYVLGLKSKEEGISFFNDKAVAGSLTMTSVKIS